MREALQTDGKNVIASVDIFTAGYSSSPVSDAIGRVQRWLATAFAARTVDPRSPSKAKASRHTTSQSHGRLDAAAQWAKISSVLGEAGVRAREAASLQATATRQLDLAQYGLITLRDELSAVMAMPSRRDGAVVHVFAAAQMPVRGQALAA
jgi:hypothetical protein